LLEQRNARLVSGKREATFEAPANSSKMFATGWGEPFFCRA